MHSRDFTINDGSTNILSWIGLNTDFDWIGIWSFIRDFKILAGISAVAALSIMVVYGVLKFNPGMRVYKLVARTIINQALFSLLVGSVSTEMTRNNKIRECLQPPLPFIQLLVKSVSKVHSSFTCELYLKAEENGYKRRATIEEVPPFLEKPTCKFFPTNPTQQK